MWTRPPMSPGWRTKANTIFWPGYNFLGEPRRFGKSLLVDTLAEAFAGSRDLFAGLYLDDHWDWNRTYPVKPSLPSLPTFRMTGIGATIWPGMKATGPRWSIACLPH
jgi:hypothetical protein